MKAKCSAIDLLVKGSAALEDCAENRKEEKAASRDYRVGRVVVVGGKACKVEIIIRNRINNTEIPVEVSRAELTPTKLRKLIVENGGICQDKKVAMETIENQISRVLMRCEKSFIEGKALDKSDLKAMHDNIGWLFTGEPVFCSNKIIGAIAEFESEYCGYYDVTSKGSITEIQAMAKRWIEDNGYLQAAMAIGAAATVLPFANEVWDENIYNPVVHLEGNSATGKSTVAKLISSFGGNPNAQNAFFISFLGTKNAIMKQVSGVNGIPVSIDECSVIDSKSKLTDMVYMLSNGRDKSRLSAGGSALQEQRVFETVIVSNGESSILAKCSKNEGIRARLFEIIQVPWTKSAEEADDIKNTVSNNYGFLSNMVAKDLLNRSDTRKERFRHWLNKVNVRIKTDKVMITIGNRIAEYVALFMTSAEIILPQLGIRSPKYSMLFEFFYKHIVYTTASDCNIAERAYNAIKSYVAVNRSKFVDYGCNCGWMSEDKAGFVLPVKRGRMLKDGKLATSIYCITPTVMEDILENAGFSNMDLVMKELMKEKYLSTKDDRRTTRELKVNGIKLKLYGVYIRDDAYNFFEELDMFSIGFCDKE